MNVFRFLLYLYSKELGRRLNLQLNTRNNDRQYCPLLINLLGHFNTSGFYSLATSNKTKIVNNGIRFVSLVHNSYGCDSSIPL